MDKGVARAVPVKTGASDESYVQILDGLKAGETVVTGPYRILKKLKTGDRIVKRPESQEEEKENGGKSGSESEGS